MSALVHIAMHLTLHIRHPRRRMALPQSKAAAHVLRCLSMVVMVASVSASCQHGDYHYMCGSNAYPETSACAQWPAALLAMTTISRPLPVCCPPSRPSHSQCADDKGSFTCFMRVLWPRLMRPSIQSSCFSSSSLRVFVSFQATAAPPITGATTPVAREFDEAVLCELNLFTHSPARVLRRSGRNLVTSDSYGNVVMVQTNVDDIGQPLAPVRGVPMESKGFSAGTV